jgi:hypothetical protein
VNGNSALSVGVGGLVDVSGGTVWRDLNEGHMSLGVAGGTVRIRDGGALLLTNTVEYTPLKTIVFGGDSTLEIGSNGVVDVHSQFSIRNGAALKATGRGADIRIGWLGSNTDAGNEIVFELDEAGVSTINVVGGWCSLGDVALTVDGSAYTGGATTSVLVDAVNLHSTSTVVTVEGFGELYSASVVQDQGTDEVRLVIALTQYGQWASAAGLSGGDALLAANPDRDRLNNLGEYALGGAPTNAGDVGILPTIAMTPGGDVEYVYRRRRDAASRGLLYTVEGSSDLVSAAWSTGDCTETGAGPVDAQFETVTNLVDLADVGFVRLTIGVH